MTAALTELDPSAPPAKERKLDAYGVADRADPLDWLLVRHEPRRLELVHIEVRKANESEAQRQME
jgi:hypothetical protein